MNGIRTRVPLSGYIAVAVLSIVCDNQGRPAGANPTGKSPPPLTLDEAGKKCQTNIDTNQCPPEVLPICQQAADNSERALGQNHPRTTKMIYNLGECLLYRGQLAQSETTYRRSLAIRQETLGKEHVAVAESLFGVASTVWVQGRFEEAEALHRQSLAMRQKLTGNEHADVAISLNALSGVVSNRGRHREAEELCRQALAIQQKILGPEHKDVADTLNNLAAILNFQGKAAEAEAIQRKVIAMRKKQLGAEHPDIAQALNNLANILENQGKYGEAEEIHRQGIVIAQKHLGREHINVVTSINNLGLVLFRQGKYREAEELFRQTLALRQKLLGMEHPHVADGMNNLSLVLDRQGKYGEAERNIRQALALRQKLLGDEHPQVAESMNGLAGLLELQGKNREAEEIYRQAIAILQKQHGREHPHVAILIGNLTIVLRAQKKYAEAEELARQTLAMRQKLLGPDHPDVAQSLTNLGAVLCEQGKFAEAEALFRQSRAIWQKLGDEHPGVALALNNVAFALDIQQRYGEAEGLHRQSLAMRRKLLGGDHPDVAQSLYTLARHFISQAKPAQAVPLLQQAIGIQEIQLRAVVSETRMQALLEQMRRDDDTVYGLLMGPGASGATKLALHMALLRKGRMAEAGVSANRLVQRSLDRPSVRQRFDEWMGVRQRRETLLFGGLGKRSPETYQKQLQALQIQAESLEHALAAEVPELRSIQPPPLDEIVAKVAQRLPPDGVLVEVVWVRPFQGYGRADKQIWGKQHFIALLLFPDQRIEWIDLGEASQVDRLAAQFLQALSRTASNPTPPARALYDQILGKLQRHLVGRKEIYLSLDGSLNLVPFDALHDGTGYLIGRYRFHYLTSGRDLLRDPSNRQVGPALVLGNPSFGAGAGASSETSSLLYQRLAGLPSLPWAQQESDTVARLLGVRALTGDIAKEEVLHGPLAPSVLHLATHGIFLTDVEPGPLPSTRSALALANVPVEKAPAPGASSARLPGEFGPMNRSALVLAGARQSSAVEDKSKDGLLTAEEARSLDLDGTQLVVLSACDTGQGETASGQGVYGLRRAFLVAGAETVVTSLWRVHDEATGELMSMYYGKLLDKQHPGDRLTAMVESMQALRTRPGREHPYYWAPFLVIGSDGPLREHTAH